jgi:hypothetical protein
MRKFDNAIRSLPHAEEACTARRLEARTAPLQRLLSDPGEFPDTRDGGTEGEPTEGESRCFVAA